MKTFKVYLFAIIGPLLAIFLLYKHDIFQHVAIPIIVYAFIYRPYIDSLRLYHLGVIKHENHKKWFIPFGKAWWYGVTHFRELIYGRG